VDKSRLLWGSFLPQAQEDDLVNPDHDYPAPKFSFKLVTNEKIHRVILRLNSDSRPPDQMALPHLAQYILSDISS